MKNLSRIFLSAVLCGSVLMLVAAPKAKAGGKKHHPPTTGWWLPPLTSLSLDPANWSIRYSIGMPPKPTVNPNGPGWFFDFPVHATSDFSDCKNSTCITPDPDWIATSCCESIHYLTQPYTGPLTIGQNLSATITINTTGNPVFLFDTQPDNNGNTPASVRFFVQVLENRNPPPYVMIDPNARWWSNPVALVLQNTGGQVILSAPIDPSQWSNVSGLPGNYDSDTLAGFNSAMQTHDSIGFTFGGGSFFGHGVGLAAGGTARFTLSDFRIQ